jgi:hypothetical protein
VHGVSLGDVRETAFLVVVGRCAIVVAPLLVRGEETAERDDRPTRRELDRLRGRRLATDPQRDGASLRVFHL